jgi:hypothetical protein
VVKCRLTYYSIIMSDSESRRLHSIKVTTISNQKTTLVQLLYPTMFKFSCTLDLRLFPFDLQQCVMVFGSWIHDNTDIDYFTEGDSAAAIDTSNCIENEGWNIVRIAI